MPGPVRLVYDRPDFKLQAERFGHPSSRTKNRDRPYRLEFTVKLHSHGEGGKPGAVDPISCIPAPGSVPKKGPFDESDLGDLDGDLANYDNGHLAALELGGPNDNYNVVPMYPSFNRRGAWRQLEYKVRKLRKVYKRVSVTIRVHYQSDGRIPDRFDVWVYGNGKELEDDLWDEPIKHLLPTRTKLSIPPDLEVLFRWGKANMPGDWGRDFSGTSYPTVGPRPYEVLAYIEEQKGIDAWPEDLRSAYAVRPRGGFVPVQRKLIHWYNRWNQAAEDRGYLVSDDPGDPEPDLNAMGAEDAPEVDHIVPNVRGGSNDYRNARLVSWKLNNSEERIKDIADLFKPTEASTLMY